MGMMGEVAFVTDKMFCYMQKVIGLADSAGRFDIFDVSKTDEEVILLMDAERRGWIITRAYNSRVTKAGSGAYLVEKDRRDQIAEAAAHEAKGRVKKKISEVALAILVAVIAAAAGSVVTHGLQ